MLVQRALGAGFREVVTVEMATAGVASQVTGGGESVTASDEVGNDEVEGDGREGDAVTVSGAVTGDEKWIGEMAGDERVSERASERASGGPVSATADAASAIVIASASAVIVHRTAMMNCR